MTPPDAPGRSSRQALWPGLVLVLAGGAFLLDSLHLLDLHRLLSYWPALLVAAGAARLLTAGPGDSREQLVGGVLLGIGGFLLLRRLGWLHVGWHELWPLLLIGMGVLILARRTGQSGPFADAQRDVRDRQLDLKTALSAQQVRVQAQDFAGGQVEVVMGSLELDLSQADFQRAVLEVSLVMAGLVLRLPPDCRLRVAASTVLGQVEDRTSPQAATVRELEIRGSLVLAGLTVRS